MKILMVTPFYYPTIGGTESFIENITSKLNEMGIHTDIMTFGVGCKRAVTTIRGVNVIKVPAINIRPLEVFQINFLPRRFSSYFKLYDIIHFHNDVDLSFPLFSYFAVKPKIFHCHCLDTTYHFSYKRNILARHLLRSIANIYIALSRFVLEMLVDLGVPEANIRVVPNGINVQMFRPRQDLEVKDTLLFVGRISPKKGLQVLLKALDFLDRPVRLVIIGARALDNPRALKYSQDILALISRANDRGPHEVKYLGVLPLEKVTEWYQRASVFVLPSLSESFPLINLEALACETPVVASDVGAVSEVVRNNKNGILVPPNNPVRLASALNYLLNNRKIRREFGRNGRRLVIRNFSHEAVAKELCEIYEELINTNATSLG